MGKVLTRLLKAFFDRISLRWKIKMEITGFAVSSAGKTDYIYGMFWKNKKIICGAGLYHCRGRVVLRHSAVVESGIFPRPTRCRFWKPKISANMMLVTPERAVATVLMAMSGRAYRNFVQIAALSMRQRSLQGYFQDGMYNGHCEYSSFVILCLWQELRVAERLAMSGMMSALWQPQDPAVMKKINAFFRSQWVYYRGMC